MRTTNWSTHETFGGEGLTSRWTQKRVAATDHCVAIIKRCPRCFSDYVATPGHPPDHACLVSD